MFFRTLAAVCLAFFIQCVHASQTDVAMEEFGELTLPHYGDKANALEQVRRDIILMAGTLGWVPYSMTENSVILRHEKRTFRLDVLLNFTTESFKISHSDSVGLGYEKSADGGIVIHPNYNR